VLADSSNIILNRRKNCSWTCTLIRMMFSAVHMLRRTVSEPGEKERVINIYEYFF